MKKSIVVLLLLSAIVCAQDNPLSEKWENNIHKGIEFIQVYSFGAKGDMIYALSTDDSRSQFYIYNLDGKEDDEMTVSRTGSQGSSKEEVLYAIVGDPDENAFLDIFTAVELRAYSIVNHPLYRHQRIPEYGLNRFYNRQIWESKGLNKATTLSIFDIQGDGSKEVVISTSKGDMVAIQLNASVNYSFSIDKMIWDMQPYIYEKRLNKTIVHFFMGCFDGVFDYDIWGNPLWGHKTNTRVQKVYVFENGSDSFKEYYAVTKDKVIKLDLHGKLIWEKTFKDPVALDRLSYLGSGGGDIIVADGKTLVFLDSQGNKKWEKNVGERINTVKFIRSKEYNLVVAGTVNSIIAYDLDTDMLVGLKGDKLYKLALDAFQKKDYNMSLYYSEQAFEYFDGANRIEKALKADEIMKKSQKIMDANTLLEEANIKLKEGSYEESLELSRKAIGLFTELGFEKGIEEGKDLDDELQKRIHEKIKSAKDITEGSNYYDLAMENFEERNYQLALDYAKKSKEIFSKVGNVNGVKMSEKLIELSEKEVNREVTTTSLYEVKRDDGKESKLDQEDVITYAVIGLAVLFIGLAIKSRISKS